VKRFKLATGDGNTRHMKGIKGKRISRQEALKKHLSRSRRARCMDESETAKVVLKQPDDNWLKNMDRVDTLGIDVPTRIIPGKWTVNKKGQKVWIKEKLVVSKKVPEACSTNNYDYLSDEAKERGINPAYLSDEKD
jgi:hypothetical protein